MIKAYNFLMKYGNLLAMVVAILILALFLININSGMNSMGFDSNTNLIEHKDKVNFFNNTLWIAIYMIFIAAIVWILFGIYNLVLNPKGSLKFLISLIVVVVLYFIFYSTATVETSGRLGELLSDSSYHVDGNITKHISAGLKTMLSLFGLSILSLIVSEIISFFK
jgi:fatty acid desaturase